MTRVKYDEESWQGLRTLIELDLADTAESLGDSLKIIGRGERFIISGMDCILHGRLDWASRCFERALEWVYGDVGPPGPVRRETIVTPQERQILPDGTQIVSQSVSFGLDEFEDAGRWRKTALCKWLHRAEHEASSFEKSAELYDRFYSVVRPREVDGGSLDRICPVFEHAGREDLVLDYLERRWKKFKAPQKPTQVRNGWRMAWVLVKHRTEGFWSEQEVAQAFESLFRANMDMWFDGGRWEEMALWTKRALWNPGSPHNPPPYECLRRCFEYVRDLEGKPLKAPPIAPGT